MNVVQLQGEGMNEMMFKKFCYLVIGLGAIALLNGCGGTDRSSGTMSRQYYDTYMDMPGYYDFGRPVVFLPTEEYFTAPEEIDESPEIEEPDN
jgi:hypothetical protein